MENAVLHPLVNPQREDEEEVFAFKTTPLFHQRESFAMADALPKMLLADDQGLGKTKQAIDIAVYRKIKLGLRYCLIVCGLNDLKTNWEDEVKMHSHEKSYMLGKRIGGWGKVYPGSTRDKLVDLDKIENGEIEAFFIITNIEGLRNPELQDKLFELTNTGEIGMVVIDEIHKACNWDSKQGRAISKLQSHFKLALSGTPFMNRITDLFVPLNWLGVENNTFHYFRNRYCVLGGKGGEAIKGIKNFSELKRKIDQVMLRRLKSEVLTSLKPKEKFTHTVKMNARQQQLYSEVKRAIMANIHNIKLSSNPLAQLIRLRQATGWTGILSTTILESAKMDKMDALVKQWAANGDKIVIFTNWVETANVAYKRLAQYKPALVHGQLPKTIPDCKAQRDRFMDDNEDCQVLIGTFRKLGTGFNLFKGNKVLMIDEPWNEANEEQAADRLHRIGQKGTVEVHILLTEATIDVRINEIVEEKAVINRGVIEGDEEVIYGWSMSNDDLVDRLLS